MSEEKEKEDKRLGLLYFNIKALLDAETQEIHIANLTAQLMNLKIRLDITTFELTVMIIGMIESLEKKMEEAHQLKEMEGLLEKKNQEEKITPAKKKSGWALIQL